MKGLYTALKCFMLEFWDLQQYAPTWNSTILDYFNKLPRGGEARCIHLPEGTRICQLKVCVVVRVFRADVTSAMFQHVHVLHCKRAPFRET
jgi:hypothetical protein